MLAELLQSAGDGLCHQYPDRTLVALGLYYPVCARCTGIYLGFIVALPVLFAVYRGQQRRGSFRWLFYLIAAIASAGMLFDVVSAQYGVRETSNLIRLITGVTFGGSLGAVAYLMLVDSLAKTSVNRPVLGDFRGLGWWLGSLAATVLVTYYILPVMGPVGPVLTALAIVATFSSVATVFVGLNPRFRNSVDAPRMAVVPSAVGLAVGVAVIALAKGFRHRWRASQDCRYMSHPLATVVLYRAREVILMTKLNGDPAAAVNTCADIRPGDEISGSFPVLKSQIRQSQGGALYLRLSVSIAGKSVPATMFDLNDSTSAPAVGATVSIRGVAQEYRGQLRIKVRALTVLEGPAVPQGVPGSEIPKTESEQFAQYLATISSRELREGVKRVLRAEGTFRSLRRIPAPVDAGTQRYEGSEAPSALSQTLAVVKVATALSESNAALDRDTLLAAAMLHLVGVVDAQHGARGNEPHRYQVPVSVLSAFRIRAADPGPRARGGAATSPLLRVQQVILGASDAAAVEAVAPLDPEAVVLATAASAVQRSFDSIACHAASANLHGGTSSGGSEGAHAPTPPALRCVG